MSQAQRTQSLGPHRLSVRSSPQGVTKPKSAQSRFSEKLDFEKLDLTGEPVYRSISEGTNRRLESVQDGIDALGEYIDEKENASLVLEEEKSGDVRVLPYNHRWTEEYRKMLYAKLKAAERGLTQIFGEGPTPVTLLTLTAHQTDDRGEPRPPGEVLDDLQDGWARFRKALARATEGYRTEYLRIIEPHQSGYPHIHVALFGVAKPSIENTVQDLWVEKYGVGGEAAHTASVEVARGRSAQLKNVAQYMMKYLSKTTVRATGEQQQVEGYEAFAALLWATGARQYSASAGLSQAMSRDAGGESEGTWRFVGVGKGLEPGAYSGDEARRLMAHLSDGPWRPPPGRAPDRTLGAVARQIREN